MNKNDLVEKEPVVQTKALRQAEHSPLPWDYDTDDLATWINCVSIPQPIAKMGKSTALPTKANAAFIVLACNNVKRLAEILNDALVNRGDWRMEAHEILAQWYASNLSQMDSDTASY